jgi:2,5-diketo-D-gluconate reductase A
VADQPTITLNDSDVIPQLGLGLWLVTDAMAPEVCIDAMKVGYRLLDSAQGYGNEAGVGRAIRESGIPREEIFVTSKLANGLHARDAALRSFDETMRKLGVDQLDLFLIHWPVPSEKRYVEAWKTLIELRDQGRIRSIGVSNFNLDHLERIIGETGVTPAVNQIELHPAFQQRDKRAFHKEHKIAIESWSPLGAGGLISDATIARIAKKHGRTPAQVMIRWHLQEGLIAIPKSAKPARLRENFAVFDFTLDDDDLRAIAAMDDPRRGRRGDAPEAM